MEIFPLILLLGILFGKTLFPQAGKIIYGGDLLTQFYYWKGFLVEGLRSGIIPYWNPYLFSGTPFLAHPATSFFYPATLLFIFLPLNLAFSWNYFLHLVIGGMGTYFVVRKYADKLSSFIASYLFAFSGYFTARIYAGHFDLLTTAVWLPWVFGFYKETLDTGSKKNMVLTILFLSLEILAGYQAYVIFTLELLVLYTVYFLFIKSKFGGKKHKTKKTIILFIAIVLFSVLITGIQWLPTWQLSKLSIRGQGLPYELASWGSLPLTSLKLFFQPLERIELNKISFNLGGGPLPNPFDHFFGRLPLILIAIYIILVISFRKINLKLAYKLKIHPDFWFYIFASGLFTWISMAYYVTPNLHFLLYKIIPLYRFIRIPIQHLLIPVFLVPLVIGTILNLLKNKTLKIIIGALMIIELFNFGQKYIFLTNIPENNYDEKLIDYLKNNLKGNRLLPKFRVVSPVLSDIDFNSMIKYKFSSTSGYDPVILRNYYDFIDLNNQNHNSSILQYNVEIPPLKINPETVNLLNIGYILTEKSDSLIQPDLKSKIIPVLNSGIWTLYKNEDVLPRYFMVYDSDCKDKLKDMVEETMRGLNKVDLKVTAQCSGILASSDVYYPGWKVKVDGRENKIINSDLAFRSVELPSGTHLVSYYYQPDIYIVGMIISIAGLSGLILFYRFFHED